MSFSNILGALLQATVRHRIDNSGVEPKNTSWALVTMSSAMECAKVLASHPIYAGSVKLNVNKFSKKHASISKGAMGVIPQESITKEQCVSSAYNKAIITTVLSPQSSPQSSPHLDLLPFPALIFPTPSSPNREIACGVQACGSVYRPAVRFA